MFLNLTLDILTTHTIVLKANRVLYTVHKLYEVLSLGCEQYKPDQTIELYIGYACEFVRV